MCPASLPKSSGVIACDESCKWADGPTVKCCSPFDVDSVKACPVASNCTIFPVATSVVGVCDFDLVGLAAAALVGWVVDCGFAAGDEVAAGERERQGTDDCLHVRTS